MVAYKNILIEQITKPNLAIAIAAGREVFPKDSEKIKAPETPYRWSVRSKKVSRKKPDHYKLLVYYLIYNHYNQVVAITGLYHEEPDPKDTYWLGWYGVLPEFRGQGYGKTILEYTELLVKKLGGTTLKLWTTEEPDEAAAQILFEKMNYEIVDRKTETIDTTSYNMLIRSKTL